MDNINTFTCTEPYPGILRILCPGYNPGPGDMPGFGRVIVTLVLGEDKALLFDTGYSHYDVKSYAETLTGLPMTVVLSHGHIDHVGGNRLFNEVWIKAEDVPLMRQSEKLQPELWCDAVKKADINYKVNLLEDGQIFDLGGRQVEVVPIPGHTSGCIGLLDHKTNILLSGDAILKRVLLIGGTPMRIYREALDALDKREFVNILGAHWPDPLGRDYVRRVISLLDSFKPGKERCRTMETRGYCY